MLSLLSLNWRLLLLRGAFSVLFGILALAWPGLTVVALVFLFGAYALVDGITALVVGFTGNEHASIALPLLEGLLGIGAALITFFYPGITAISLLLLIAAWAILTGIAQIAGAIALRRELTGEWRLAVAGVLSVIFGVLLVANPAVGALAVVWVIGIYAIVFGVTLFALGMRLRRPTREIPIAG